ncbi:MAG: D-sedoheptulose 7-phosphate isomerase [Blastocatellia bacterium]|nr:D-sedoheptulose 7-phosphate isomerase [Blastocatellia bacterium]
MTPTERILHAVETGIELKRRFFSAQSTEILRAATVMGQAVQKGGKLLIFGNGGSAADAQHFAAELVHRLDHTRPERPGIPALALTTDSSTLTAIANDASFLQVYSRQINALGRAGDVAVGISTSGTSKNIVEAIRQARTQGLATVGLLGNDGGTLRDLVDVALVVPHTNTPRVQEVHLLIEHLLCELIEDFLFPPEQNS